MITYAIVQDKEKYPDVVTYWPNRLHSLQCTFEEACEIAEILSLHFTSGLHRDLYLIEKYTDE